MKKIFNTKPIWRFFFPPFVLNNTWRLLAFILPALFAIYYASSEYNYLHSLHVEIPYATNEGRENLLQLKKTMGAKGLEWGHPIPIKQNVWSFYRLFGHSLIKFIKIFYISSALILLSAVLWYFILDRWEELKGT